MTNYEFFFGSAERVAKLCCGDFALNKMFIQSWSLFKQKKLETEANISMRQMSDTMTFVQIKEPEWWLEFLNEEFYA